MPFSDVLPISAVVRRNTFIRPSLGLSQMRHRGLVPKSLTGLCRVAEALAEFGRAVIAERDLDSPFAGPEAAAVERLNELLDGRG